MALSGIGAYQQIDTYQPLERATVGRGAEGEAKTQAASVKSDAGVAAAAAAATNALSMSTFTAAEATSAVAAQNSDAVRREPPSSAGFSVQSVISARQNQSGPYSVGTHLDAQI